MRKPDLNVQEWAVVSQVFHIAIGDMLLEAGSDDVSPDELDAARLELRRLLEAEWGHPGPESDQMIGLRVVMESVWEQAIPSLKAARPRRLRQPDLFDEA